MTHARILFATILSLALFAAGVSPAQAAVECICESNYTEVVASCDMCNQTCSNLGSAQLSCEDVEAVIDGGKDAGSSATQQVKCDPSKQVCLKNPLGVDDPLKFVGRLIKGLLGIIGGVALALFIYGGFLWMTSGGSSEKIQKGRDTLLWTSIGLAVIFASYAMVDFIIKGLTGK